MGRYEQVGANEPIYPNRESWSDMNAMTAKVIAGCFALSAFSVAILAGLASENTTAQILQRAVLSMIVCYPVGLIIGMVCERVIVSHIRAHERANPAPDSNAEAPPPAPAPDNDEEAIVV